MTSLQSLKPALKLWKRATLASEDGWGGGDHPDDYDLYHLASTGGLATAGPHVITHLSRCPACLEKLALWCTTMEGDEAGELEGREPLLSYGMLAAAATAGTKEALRLTSSCGNFIFGFYPQTDETDKAMVSLELSGDAEKERRYLVRDAKGRLLIDGIPSQGRLARLVDHAGEVDLSCWTIVSPT